MDACLYGPDGFYSTRGSAGRSRGDFITSPEVGPLFGAVIARALEQWWQEAGCPDPWTIYDVGAGPGTLLRSIGVAVAETRPWELKNVDIASGDHDLAELPSALDNCVVLANELLDNMPFRVVERRDDGLYELFVADGERVWRPSPVRLEQLELPVGGQVPLLEQASAWVANTLDRGASRVVVIDYGATTTAELASRGGWLRTYRQHQRGHDPLAEPGRWDITTDIAVDQLPSGSIVTSQADFLRRWGIESLVAEGKDYWMAHAAAPDLKAFRMRSRIAEAEALLDPAGLGSWLICQWMPG